MCDLRNMERLAAMCCLEDGTASTGAVTSTPTPLIKEHCQKDRYPSQRSGVSRVDFFDYEGISGGVSSHGHIKLEIMAIRVIQ